MSYILEAIKKADQKRKLGSVPDVHTVHDGPLPVARRLLWPYILAVGLFINAGLIVLWLHPWAQVKVKTKAVMNNSRAVVAVAREQDNGEAGKPLANPPAEEVVANPGHHAEQPLNEDLQITVTPKALPKDAAAIMPTVSGEGPVKEEKRVLQVGAQGTETEEPGLRLKTTNQQHGTMAAPVSGVVETLKDKEPTSHSADKADVEGKMQNSLLQSRGMSYSPPGQVPGGAPPKSPKIVERIGGRSLPDTDYGKLALARDKQTEMDRRELAKIPFLYQLPEDFRKDLPRIHISFLSYSYTPAKRLVSINGKLLREGQNIEVGLQLAKITPVGIVLTYKSRQFKVELSTSNLKD